MVFNLRTVSFSSSGSEEPEVVQSDLIEEPLSLRSALLRLNCPELFSQLHFLVSKGRRKQNLEKLSHTKHRSYRKEMVFNLRTISFSSSGSEEPEVVQSDLIEEPLSLRSALLRLNGHCYSEKDRFLVCPFVSDSDVDDTDLLELGDWLSLKRVALGVARGLAHLQGKSRIQIQSILLICAGNEFMAIPGVFGSFKGYPQLHGEGDVHGYGVMLLQLMTGEEQSFLLELITHDGMNPKCCAAMFTLRSPRNYIQEEGEQLARLAFCCAVNYPDRIASMSEVVKTLEQVVCSADLLMSSPDPSDRQKF